MTDHVTQEDKCHLLDEKWKSFRSTLYHIDPRIDPLKFQEMIVTHLIGNRSLSEMSIAEQRVLIFRVELEIEHDLDLHVTRYNRYLIQSQDERNSQHVDAVMEFHGSNPEFQEEILTDEQEVDSDAHLPEVDRAVAPGGLTRLHIAAVAGDLDQVKMLIEECQANHVAVDAYRLTPLGRAEMMGHRKVIDYLKSLS